MAEAEAATYKIIDLSKVPSAEAGRAGKYDLIVTYQDTAGRVRIVTIPYEEFAGKTEDEQAETLRKYIGMQET
ncbi:MAG: hypothetical protein ACXQT3_01565, partial [Methermicoccaceae archaeon]